MRLFGLEINRVNRLTKDTLQAVDTNRGWWPIVRESYPGAWQQNVDLSVPNVTTHAAVFACATLIAGDISKMRPRVVQQTPQTTEGIWAEVEVPSFSPVLRKPNPIQNRIQFYTSWILSKLLWGNAYVAKVYDNSGDVRQMFVIDPSVVTVLIGEDGSVFYEIRKDKLSRIPDKIIVRADAIIHDRFNTLFHPLAGLTPIYACGMAAVQGLNIQGNSSKFFSNDSNPGGILTAPGTIKQVTADRISEYINAGFSGDNIGKLMVLGDGLKYEPIGMRAVDAQLIEQLRWTAENVCAAFHVPPYMIGVGPMPNYNNIEALNKQYYSQCLQVLIESIELCLDEGLGLTVGSVTTKRYGVEFDKDDLLTMDTKTLIESEKLAAGIKSPNESRKRLNLPNVEGGDQPFLQQQNWPIAELAARDEMPPDRGLAPAPVPEETEEETDDTEERFMQALMVKAAAFARQASHADA